MKPSDSGKVLIFLNSIMVLCVLNLLSVVWIHANYGLDLTDESYYLLWMAKPWDYLGSVTQYGFLLHPLYNLLQGSIVLIRQVNYFITFSLAFLVCFTFLWKHAKSSGFLMISSSFAIATTSLLITNFELSQTPSYNTLAFQALLIGAIAINIYSEKNYISALLLGFSICLAFMAKPTTSVVLLLASFLVIFPIQKSKINYFLWVFVSAALCFILFALMVDGSLIAFLHRYIEGFALLKTIDADQSIFPWQKFPLEYLHQYRFLLAIISCTLILYVYLKNNFFEKLIISLSLVLVITSYFLLSKTDFVYSFSRFDGLFVLIIPLSCYLLIMIRNNTLVIKYEYLLISLFYMILPFAYAAGTNRPMWLNAEGALFFWFMAALAMICSDHEKDQILWKIHFIISAMAIGISAYFLKASIMHPYRQEVPLHANTTPIDIDKKRPLFKIIR